MVIFSHPIVAALPAPALRIAFWILLGLSAALFFEYGVWLLISMVAALMAITVWVKGGRETLKVALNSLADGARHALPVGVACALVGTIIGIAADRRDQKNVSAGSGPAETWRF